MAAGESATVFLETSLGTRLVVSFPARATTVADLKRQVSAEHAACFPRAGPIAVTSLQVKQDGSLFHLTDSMVVQAAFHWVKGPWHLLVEAHGLRSHPLGCKDAKCGTGDTEENAGHLVAKDSTRNMLPPAASLSQGGGNRSSGDGDSDTRQMNKQDVEHASGQLEGGNTVPRESSDLDLAAGDSDTQPTSRPDKSSEAVEHAMGQCEDGNTKPQESSDLDVAADKGNGPVGGQQKEIILEPRGNKRFREEDTNDESISANCDGSLSSLATSTLSAELSEQKSSGTEEANLNSDPLPCNLGDCSHGFGEKPSCDQKEPLTPVVCNGESSKNGSDIPTCVESMERDNSSDKEVKAHRGDEQEPRIAGLCAGESSSKGTDVPHCVESMKEDSRRPASSDHYLDKGKYERATSTVSIEHNACFQKRQQRVVVRKVPMSRAVKLCAFRC